MKIKKTFIDLRSDFGFKHCMGDEIIMKSFLNAVLSEDYGHIESLKFENTEAKRLTKDNRGAIFDIRCKLDDGTSILVEMQNYMHCYFETRANYYLCKVLEDVVKAGTNWRSMKEDIPRIVGIFIMGVEMEKLKKVVTKVAKCDIETGDIFWDREWQYYISLPHVKELCSSPSTKEVWFDFFKNLGNMERIDERVLERADEGLLELIKKAQISALSAEEYAEYEAALKILADEGVSEAYGYNRGMKDGIEKGMRDGLEKGRIEADTKHHQEILESATTMILAGLDDQLIIKFLPSLSLDEIRRLREDKEETSR